VLGMSHSATFAAPDASVGPGAINQKAVSQYVADVSKTPLGTGAVLLASCYCDVTEILCCQSGLCSDQCIAYPPMDAAPLGEQDAQNANAPAEE
jgi:hypothetical protein